MTDNHEKIQLTRALKSRHIFMLSLGGVIGTGLFMGSGVTINQGGPVGAILAYLVAGLLMYLVMVCWVNCRCRCRCPARSRPTPRSSSARPPAS